ncbi:hypothetical protein P3T40_003547 [Paraburkholderia sp. EB58]|uniref:VapE domain-containing protein n=1 Tax=Paraburkholderia sp. EB58 TaxID=3035125 RepID=UPI003D1B5D74
MAKKFNPPTKDEVNSEEFQLEMQALGDEAQNIADVNRAGRDLAEIEREKIIETAMQIVDIAERAKELEYVIQFAHVKKVRMGDMFIAVPEPTDTNKRVVLDYLFKGAEAKPHFDEFRGRIVDHAGVIMDDFYDGTAYLDAFEAIGLKKLKLKEVIDAVRAYALRQRQNDLCVRVEKRIPEWDGETRMKYAFEKMFGCEKTEMNREISHYFFLSLFGRVMYPGEEAPIVVTLIGAQGCGKSYFGKLLTRMITGDKEADSVQLDLGAGKIDFLREITGNSVVASVGEMTGFGRGDLNKIKDFITRTHDKFHHKFEGVVHQGRQWVTVMDANRYEGLLRDETGSRRFFPIFCGQLPDVAGKQQWKADFMCNFALIRENLWQLLAEAKVWFEINGADDYRHYVRQVSKMVFEWSVSEMAQDRGTIADDVFDTHLVDVLKRCPKKAVCKFKIGGKEAVRIGTTDLKIFFHDQLPTLKPNWRHLKNKMNALGGEEHTDSKGYLGYVFKAFPTIDDFNSRLGDREYESDGEIVDTGPGSGKAATRAAGF